RLVRLAAPGGAAETKQRLAVAPVQRTLHRPQPESSRAAIVDANRPPIPARAARRPVHRTCLLGTPAARPRLDALPPRARKTPQAPLRTPLSWLCAVRESRHSDCRLRIFPR